jgi:DNA-binding transcriptional ArsR family regulator
MSVNVSDTCNLLAMISIPSRLKALRFLCSNSAEASLADVMRALGEESGQVVAFQLDLLRSVDLVEARRQEGGLMYRITAAGRSLLQGVAAVEGVNP